MPARPDRRVLLLGVGIPLAALLVVVGVTVLGGGDDEPNARGTDTSTSSEPTPEPTVDEAWNQQLAEALGPLRGTVPTYATQVEAWATGALAADALARVLDDVERVLAGVDSAAQELGPHPSDDLAGPLVDDALGLYREAVRSHRAALAAQDRQVAEQYDRLGRRLRILGDRVFDRARERTAVAFDPGEDVRLVLPAEVPDWSRLELAVGPPLDEGSDVTDEVPPAREDQRATQPAEQWLAALDELDVPTVDDVRGAAGAPERLGALARRLVDAAEALRDVPVPDGDRGRADRVALGWLVRADAARAGQLGALTGADGPLAERLLDLAAAPALGPA